MSTSKKMLPSVKANRCTSVPIFWKGLSERLVATSLLSVDPGSDLLVRMKPFLKLSFMAGLIALVNANHAGLPFLGHHLMISDNGRNVGFVFAPSWVAAKVLVFWL